MAIVGVILAAANEERTVGAVIDGVRAAGVGRIVVVDDGSRDRTGEIAEKHGATVIRHPRNLGKGEALKSGFRRAVEEGWDLVIVLDADGQHDPAEIPGFLEAARRSPAGIIVGNRMNDVREMPLVRRVTNRTMSFLLSRICRQRIPDTQCGYRLLRKDVLETINLSTGCFETESEMLIEASRAGFRIDSVPIRTIYSREASKINPFVDTWRFLLLVLRTRTRRSR